MSNYMRVEQTSDVYSSGTVGKVPVEILRDLKSLRPIPVTISGANQVTFSVPSTETNPLALTIGPYYLNLKSTQAYTWTDGVNNILATDGSASTVTACTTGVWYFYLVLTDAGVLSLLPSTVAPSYVSGVNDAGSLQHPGTARSGYTRYVGYHVCTATTPVFLVAEKIQDTYHFAAQNVAITNAYALLDYSAVLPAHGVVASGHLTMPAAAAAVVTLGGSSTTGRGSKLYMSGVAGAVTMALDGVQINSAGKFYAGCSTADACSANITLVKDIT